jgi:hypothetical protein
MARMRFDVSCLLAGAIHQAGRLNLAKPEHLHPARPTFLFLFLHNFLFAVVHLVSVVCVIEPASPTIELIHYCWDCYFRL